MKKIELSRRGKYKGLYFALVDDEDFDYLNQWRWHVKKEACNNYHAARPNIGGKPTLIPMHRQLLNPPKGVWIDHIDHNGLNNQRSNLRLCNNGQNQSNKRASGKSKYLGVSIRKKRGYIFAQLRNNGKLHYLGTFVFISLSVLLVNYQLFTGG